MPKIEITTLVALASGGGWREFLVLPAIGESRRAMITIGWTSRPGPAAGPGQI